MPKNNKPTNKEPIDIPTPLKIEETRKKNKLITEAIETDSHLPAEELAKLSLEDLESLKAEEETHEKRGKTRQVRILDQFPKFPFE